MASIISRNGKYAVIHYEGDDRHQVMKSGLTKAQAEKLKAKKDAEEKRWREQRKRSKNLLQQKLCSLLPLKKLLFPMLHWLSLWKSLSPSMVLNIGEPPIMQVRRL